MRNDDGTVEIFNLDAESAETIKQKTYYDPNIIRVKTKEEKEREIREQKQKISALLAENQDRDEEDDPQAREGQLIDYSTQYKTFLVTDKSEA